MSLKNKISVFSRVCYIFLIIEFTGVECDNGYTEDYSKLLRGREYNPPLLSDEECDNGYTELYSELLNGRDYFVPPSSRNITVSANLELVNIMQIDTRNQDMTISAILNLYWEDSILSWNQSESPCINPVTLPAAKIWTPNIIIWNSAADSKNIHRGSGDLFISSNGQVHWPIFGNFKTFCTIDVTYYPFDQQTCIIKIGPIDKTIRIDLHQNKNTVDLSQYYASVFWNIVVAPAYLNEYYTTIPAETDISYYLVLRRKTHWLSEVFPLLAFAILTIVPAALTRPLEKLILQVFCMAGLFALHKNIMTKLPPTSLMTSLVSKYIVALILYNLIHLTLTTIINNSSSECFGWIAHQIQRISSATERKNDEVKPKEDMTTIQNEEDLSNLIERQRYAGGEKIVAICNRSILILLILAVVTSTLCFLFGYPKQDSKVIA